MLDAAIDGRDLEKDNRLGVVSADPFTRVEICKRIDFTDAPGETGGLWRAAGEAENVLADKLKDHPYGTAVSMGEDLWFLEEANGERVLCHALYRDGNVSNVLSRFDSDLSWVDVDDQDLREYAERVTLATESFNLIRVTPCVSRVSQPGCPTA